MPDVYPSGIYLSNRPALWHHMAMHIIRRSAFTTVPWKNGGGITHEVAKAEADGRLLWRLSLAEVASEGPFSLFPGLARILTVIEGTGMDLLSPAGEVVLPLAPLVPVHFSGDAVLTGRLRAGPCLDFNLIYDPQRFEAAAEVVSGEWSLQRQSGAVMDGVLCLAGTVRYGEHVLDRHDFAFLEDGEDVKTVGGHAHALRLSLGAWACDPH